MASENGRDPLADEAAVLAADRFENGQGGLRLREYVMENGVVLRLKPVPPMLLRSAARNIPDPEVPVVHIESRDRDESNPSDPDYLRALGEAAERRSQAALTVGLLTGTEFASAPPGIPGPDDDEWIEIVRTTNATAGIELDLHTDKASKARYLDWLRYFAISSETELQTLRLLTTLGVALTEEEVAGAAASFRDIFARGAALDIAASAAPINGPLIPASDTGDGV